MDFIIVVLKILLTIASVFVMLFPLLSEYLSYKRDREEGITHKRFRLMLFAFIYCAVLTVVMVFAKELIDWIESWRIVVWLARKIAVSKRFSYCVGVIAVMIINFAIGFLFRILLSFVRIGLKKKDLSGKKHGIYTRAQKIERKILEFFNDEKWFFAAMILRYLCIGLVALYAAAFALCFLPIVFKAGWIPYGFAKRLLEAGYLYPMLSLLPLCEVYFFLSGVENLDEECPDFEDEGAGGTVTRPEPSVDEINRECKNIFADHFAQEIEAVSVEDEIASTEHHRVTKLIARSIEANGRNPKPIREGYLRSLDAIVENDLGSEDAPLEEKTRGVLVNGSFFTGFSEYFMRFVSVILARGDNVIFVCNDNSQIEETYCRVVQSLERIYSLYQAEVGGTSVNFDDPVWKVEKVGGDCCEIESAMVNNCSVLVTDLNFLTTACFEERCDAFVHLVDTVVFVDTLGSINDFSRQMAIFDAKVKNMREQNATRAKNSSEVGEKNSVTGDKTGFAVRYNGNQIKYICFDDTRVPGLDKVLKNLLFVDFASSDSMRYSTETVLCCYNYEPRLNENGERVQQKKAHTKEKFGVLVNMADFAVAFGSGRVSLFADKNIPFRDFAESVDSNANHGLSVENGVTLFMNHYRYDLDDCRVIIAYDDDDNLPMTIRRFRSMATDKKTLLIIFSRPYMFRDYYLANVKKNWMSEQMLRIPTERVGKHSAIQKILVKANSGGIAVEDIFKILSDANMEDYKEFRENTDIRGVLGKLLLDCGKHRNDALNWNNYFEFVEFSDFDSRGEFLVEERVCLRNKHVLDSLLDGMNPANAVIDNRNIPLPIPKNRITQNYIVGQNLLYDGCVYVIERIDVKNGRIFVKRATGGCNAVPYRYVQNREYHVDFSVPNPELVYPIVQIELGTGGPVAVKEAKVSVAKRPMEVITKGYSVVDQRTLADNDVKNDNYHPLDGEEQIDLFMQTYRKYGEVKEPVCSTESILKSDVFLNAVPSDALVMSIKFKGDFGADCNRMLFLASVMLSEVLKAMFPSVADSLAVCPILNVEAFKDEASLEILKRIPKVFCREYTSEPDEIEFLIIEDCQADLGVISVLMTSGDDVLKLLFQPVYEYLEWYLSAENHGDYFKFGLDEVPDCFDFEGLYKLATVLGKDEFKTNIREIENSSRYDVCDFCGKRYPVGTDVVVLEDGRKMCKECASALVDNNKKALKAYLNNARVFLESTYGITLDDDYEFCFESTLKIVNTLKQNPSLIGRGADIPLRAYVDDKKKVHVEYSLPSVNLSELLVRELTYVWQLKHLPDLEEELAEGHIALVATQYLHFLNEKSLASVRTTYYEATQAVSGVGYRKLVKALLENPQYRNNPFAYLMGLSDGEDILPPPPTRVIEDGEFGKPYTPEQLDRVIGGVPNYFCRGRLSPRGQEIYDVLFEAIKNHASSAVVEDGTFEEVKRVCEAIEYDHPELFWYRTFSLTGSRVDFIYGATMDEVQVLQRRIDEVVPKFLEGIDDSMSAYDVLLRLHVKVISVVDYDTIALNKEKEKGGPAIDKIDCLRSICGVFLDGKAVCEGYARAIQYLLQKCGIECAEVAGFIQKENGDPDGAHAWNIVKIDGDYYYLDTTWDDSSDTIQTVKQKGHGFDYFCITTEELLRTRDLSLNPTDLPMCDAIRANYFYHNDFVLDTYDLDKIKTIARTAAKSKGKFFSFKCKTKVLFDEALNKLCSQGTDCYAALKAAAKEDKQIRSDLFTYSYDKNIWTITLNFKYK